MPMKSAMARTASTTMLACALLLPSAGCRRPSGITFLQVPSTSTGGAGTSGRITGVVTGWHAGQRIVLYSQAQGKWWVQPFASSPYTEIAKDGSWSAEIHLGAQYAALLRYDDVLPPPSMTRLPAIGKEVEAIATVKAGGDIPPAEQLHPGPVLRFSGIDWEVRTIPGDYASKTNSYSPENVSVDSAGALHLRVSRSGSDWVCSELHSVRSFGYGSYRVDVRNLGQLEPAAMFSVFSRADASPDGDSRQMDIHISQRGDPANKNAEFVVQPYFVPANFYRFNVPAGPVSLKMDWAADVVTFSALRTTAAGAPPVASWVYTTGVPTPDDENIYLNLCNYGYARPPLQHEAEVVVDKFEFLP